MPTLCSNTECDLTDFTTGIFFGRFGQAGGTQEYCICFEKSSGGLACSSSFTVTYNKNCEFGTNVGLNNFMIETASSTESLLTTSDGLNIR